jgi:hypothetical protein
VTPRPNPAEARRGGALALPLLLCALALVTGVKAARADGITTVDLTENDHLDGGARMLFANPIVLDSLASDCGFPTAGATFLLYGGGATIAPGDLRIGVSGWTGGLQAHAGPKTTTWDLNLATLNLEQRYSQGSFLVTGGVGVDYGQFSGGLDDASTGQLTRIESDLWGYSATAGVRWPTQGRLGFFVRSGYEWLQGDGTWHGALADAGRLGGEHVNLGGPSVTAQVELSFQ